MARSEIRSSALARAQAQLAGQRVPVKPKDSSDELQEYMRALNNKSNALKLSQRSIYNLSDLSASEQESEGYKGTVSPQQTGTQSRFLKKKSQSNKNTQSNVKPASLLAKPQPMESKMPTSAALQRLAEFENRHRMRKLELDTSENDSDLRTSEERPFSNRSSSELSFHGNRFLKKRVNIKEPEPLEQISGSSIRGSSSENKRRVAESEKEQMLQLVGSSVEFSENNEKLWKTPKPPRTPSPSSRLTPRRNLHRSPSAVGISPRRPPSRFSSRTPSPPSHGTPRYPRRTHSLTRFGSRSPSPSIRSSLTSNSPRARLGRRSRTPLSQRSDLKSLDELFSRTDDPSSASSDDFKLNIMSLDELGHVAGTDEIEEKIHFNSLPMKAMNQKSEETKQAPSANLTDHLHNKVAKEIMRQKSSSGEESALEVLTETTKSEESKHHYKDYSSSSEHYDQEQPDETTVHSAYSEDFEDSVPSEKGLSSKSYSYSSPKSISSPHSSVSLSYSYPYASQVKHKKQSHITRRVTVRETSVQTNDAEFIYTWPQATIGFGPIASSIAVEPTSVVSHMVRPELIEALTTYSPMALALNDMLKQQLFLTQTFVDMAQQLYLCTVKSLESESYQYTTLEDTKEYIKQQKDFKWRRDHK